MYKDVAEDDVQVGDWADHKSGTLDPRQVSHVMNDGVFGRYVRLRLFGEQETGLLPAGNYTYQRLEGSAS